MKIKSYLVSERGLVKHNVPDWWSEQYQYGIINFSSDLSL